MSTFKLFRFLMWRMVLFSASSGAILGLLGGIVPAIAFLEATGDTGSLGGGMVLILLPMFGTEIGAFYGLLSGIVGGLLLSVFTAHAQVTDNDRRYRRRAGYLCLTTSLFICASGTLAFSPDIVTEPLATIPFSLPLIVTPFLVVLCAWASGYFTAINYLIQLKYLIRDDRKAKSNAQN